MTEKIQESAGSQAKSRLWKLLEVAIESTDDKQRDLARVQLCDWLTEKADWELRRRQMRYMDKRDIGISVYKSLQEDIDDGVLDMEKLKSISKTKLPAYLKACVKNKVLQNVRRDKPDLVNRQTGAHASAGEIEPVAQGPGASTVMVQAENEKARAEEAKLFEVWKDKLPPNARRLIQLYKIEEKSSEEVGKIMGISDALVRKKYKRIKDSLRKKAKKLEQQRT